MSINRPVARLIKEPPPPPPPEPDDVMVGRCQSCGAEVVRPLAECRRRGQQRRHDQALWSDMTWAECGECGCRVMVTPRIKG